MILSEQMLRDLIEEVFLEEAKKKKDKETVYPRQYDAPEGSERNEKLDAAAAAYERGDIKGAVQIRTSMEDKEDEKTKE